MLQVSSRGRHDSQVLRLACCVAFLFSFLLRSLPRNTFRTLYFCFYLRWRLVRVPRSGHRIPRSRSEANPSAPLAATTAAAIAGGAAAAAYLDAKFHIKKDVRTVFVLKWTERKVIKAGTPARPPANSTVHWPQPSTRYIEKPNADMLFTPQPAKTASPSGTTSKPKSSASPPPNNASGRATASTPGRKPTRNASASRNSTSPSASCRASSSPST